MRFLDETGLDHLWDKIKNRVIDYKIVNITGDAIASTTYEAFPYEITLAWENIQAADWINGAVLAGNYNGSWAVDTFDGHVVLYFETNPTATFGLFSGGDISQITGITDYNIAINMVDTGTFPDTTIIRRLYENFRDGCSTIAETITAEGVATASNASPEEIATNIATLSANRYAEGRQAGFDHVETQDFTINLSSTTAGGSNYSGSMTVKAGYTLNKSMFINITNAAYWVYNSEGATTEQNTTFHINQSETSVTVSGYRLTQLSGTIYYLGAAVITSELYQLNITATAAKTDTSWTYDGTNHPAVNSSLRGSVFVKVTEDNVTIYSNTTKVTAASAGNWEGHTYSPVTATLSNKSITDMYNGSFKISLSGYGTSGTSQYGTTSRVTGTINCTITNGVMTITKSGTLTATGHLGNTTATANIGVTVKKAT